MDKCKKCDSLIGAIDGCWCPSVLYGHQELDSFYWDAEKLYFSMLGADDWRRWDKNRSIYFPLGWQCVRTRREVYYEYNAVCTKPLLNSRRRKEDLLDYSWTMGRAEDVLRYLVRHNKDSLIKV